MAGPWSCGAEVPARGSVELDFDVAAPPWAHPGKWWAMVKVAGAGRVARIVTEPSVPIWAICLALVKVTSAAPPGCSVMFSGFCRALLAKWATTRASLSGAVAAEAGTASAMEQPSWSANAGPTRKTT